VVEFGADRSRYAGHLLELAERRLPPLAPSGVGMISLRSLLARRITRILDSTRTLSTQAGRRAIAATLLAGLAGTLLVGLLGVGAGNRSVLGDGPKVEQTSTADRASLPTTEKTPESANHKAVSGRVVDPDKAFELARNLKAEPGRVTDLGMFNAATGQRIKEPATPGAAKSEQGKAATRIMPITGRIVDLEGRPVAGATVQVTQITKPKGGRGQPPNAQNLPCESIGPGADRRRRFRRSRRGGRSSRRTWSLPRRRDQLRPIAVRSHFETMGTRHQTA